MGRTTSRAKRFGIAGLIAFMAGGVLTGTALVASAASTPTCTNSACTISISPGGPYAPASGVSVIGASFVPGSQGAMVECNMDTAAPTIAIPKNYVGNAKTIGSGTMSVGCSDPAAQKVKVAKDGSFFWGGLINTASSSLQIGPPITGQDSSGGQAAADALAYPCPPTQAEVSAGVNCAMVFEDAAGEIYASDITFTTPFSTTPTTQPTVTTLVKCDGVPATATGANTKTGTTASVTVTPATCLIGGQTVTVTGSGLVANNIGSVLECNDDSAQPTVSYLSNDIPVSCSKLALFTTSLSGEVPAAYQSFIVQESSPTYTIGGQNNGPETGGTGNLAADAAKYPCPPTAAQEAAGDHCVIAVGDIGGDQVAVPIAFNEAVPPPTGPQGGTTTPPAAKAAAKKVGSNSLAFTGTGPGLWWLGLVGVLFMVLGGFVLAVVDMPRRFLRFALNHGRRVERP
jgi:hypothetical protein